MADWLTQRNTGQGLPPLVPQQPDIQQTQQLAAPNYGPREDGSPKGAGFFGEIAKPGSPVHSTELTIDIDMGGKKHSLPLLVPTLSRTEIGYLLGGGKPTPEIVDKAIKHYITRGQQGKSGYAQPHEQVPLPQPGIQ